jgi:hypothetical protein
MRRTMLLVTVALVMAAMLVFAAPASARLGPLDPITAGGCQEFGGGLASDAHRQKGGDFGQEVSEDATFFAYGVASLVDFGQLVYCSVP